MKLKYLHKVLHMMKLTGIIRSQNIFVNLHNCFHYFVTTERTLISAFIVKCKLSTKSKGVIEPVEWNKTLIMENLWCAINNNKEIVE